MAVDPLKINVREIQLGQRKGEKLRRLGVMPIFVCTEALTKKIDAFKHVEQV